jgi:acetylornithine/succinyldiaminopimelate/putrescine aminotransferase
MMMTNKQNNNSKLLTSNIRSDSYARAYVREVAMFLRLIDSMEEMLGFVRSDAEAAEHKAKLAKKTGERG